MTGLDLEAIRTRAQRVRDERQTTSGVPLPTRLSWDVDALLDAVETLTRERDEVGVQADMLCAALERIARLSMASGTLASLAEARSIAAAALAGVSGGSEAPS